MIAADSAQVIAADFGQVIGDDSCCVGSYAGATYLPLIWLGPGLASGQILLALSQALKISSSLQANKIVSNKFPQVIKFFFILRFHCAQLHGSEIKMKLDFVIKNFRIY